MQTVHYKVFRNNMEHFALSDKLAESSVVLDIISILLDKII